VRGLDDKRTQAGTELPAGGITEENEEGIFVKRSRRFTADGSKLYWKQVTLYLELGKEEHVSRKNAQGNLTAKLVGGSQSGGCTN